ncbi:hypothetical protein EKH80_06895 [Dyella choica]|uniref:Uncharacterized protein n=2 Tax=Dyella choica TaxID=1927959 RepID=A0A3S0Q5X2_9GAMM|nr:hypothetical protein EKH80_06895 [Dyella choica]
MIPLGYLYKQVASRPEWLKAAQVTDIYSLSNCVSKDFTDYVRYWKHNGYWLFDSPDIIAEIVNDASLSMEQQKLFYYEAYELQYDEDAQTWSKFTPELSFTTEIATPKNRRLEGFDITSFSLGNAPECSPLSCNARADELLTNEHCLLGSFEEAKAVIEQGSFHRCEPGPYRIIAVYSVGDVGDSGLG